MVTATEMIVLNLTKIGESSVVLHTISSEWGRRGFLVNVGKKTSMSLFLPMNVLEAEVIENPKSSLWRATKISAKHPLHGVRASVAKNSMTMFMSEVLYRAVREDAHEEGLFEWCEKSILTLDALQSDFANYHLRFLLEFAVALGFSPTVDALRPFAGEHLSTLSQFVESSFAESMLIPLTGELRNEIAEILLRYLSYHCESSIDVRSLKVLRELFG